MRYSELGIGCSANQDCCGDGNLYGCPSDVSPSFCIKRYDTKPSFKVPVEDCCNSIDLTDENLILEYNMWAFAKLKTNISDTDDSISFADNIGFFQVEENDILVISKGRLLEHMIVTGFDEDEKLVNVQRGHNSTNSQSWKKGDQILIFRVMDAPAEIELVYENVMNSDGTVENKLVQSLLVCNWDENSTKMPGCYWLEFKLIKMNPETSEVEWMRRIPATTQGLLINIIDSPTKEL
jgi:hypothetical protein